MDNITDIQETVSLIAKERFGISYLRPFQLLIISALVQKRKTNMLAILPTGGGKSLCFMLPSLFFEGLTVIVYPLLSLMNDQKRRFDSLDIPSSVLKGGLSPEEKNQVFQSLRKRETRILITNMEMLSQKRIQDSLSSFRISLLVLDEAHTVISWGNTFRPVYKQLGQTAEILKPERIVAFTATSDEETTRQLKSEVLGENALVIQGGLDRANIIYHRVNTVFPLLDIIHILKDNSNRRAIIFTSSRKLTEYLARRLSHHFKTYCYHAGLMKEERIRIELDFRNEEGSVLVSTCAFGMGVDLPSVRTVIHYNLPQSASDYLQESGRVGRDGKISHAYAFLDNSFLDSPLENTFKGSRCLRESLISLMGQHMDSACSGCDVCDKNNYTPQGVTELRKALRIPYVTTRKTLIRKLRRKRLFKQLTVDEIEYGIRKLIQNKHILIKFNRLKFNKNKFYNDIYFI